MNEFLKQTEIIAHILNGEIISKADWAYRYEVSEITINRDLRELRQKGLQIFSKNGKVVLLEDPSKQILRNLLSNYISLSTYSEIITKKLKGLFNNNYKMHFSHLAILSQAIKSKRKIEVKYKRFYDNKVGDYLLRPISIESNELNWVLHAFKEGEETLKTFYIQRLEDIRTTNTFFSIQTETKSKNHKYTVILKFHPDVENEILDKTWFEDYKLEKDEKGFTILTTQQEITNKLTTQ